MQKRILVVDDDEMNLKRTQIILEKNMKYCLQSQVKLHLTSSKMKK